MSRVKDLIDRFGREEDAFLASEFVAPIVGRGKVRVRIAGVVCELSVVAPVAGWQVLKPASTREAAISRVATRAEVARYLSALPRARLVVTHRFAETWLGLPAAAPAKGIVVEGLIPIALGGDLRLFDTAVVRFDGALFLPEGTERPAIAAYLRDEVAKLTPESALTRKGLTRPEREAYAIELEIRRELAKSPDERRLERALEAAGAKMERYEHHRDTFVVTFRVDGVLHTSIVSKRDLTIVSAGVCLSGHDSEFDLTSLVDVLRERRRRLCE